MPKLIFKDEQDMLKAFLGCKFCQIECETDYDSNDDKGEIDLLSFEMKE